MRFGLRNGIPATPGSRTLGAAAALTLAALAIGACAASVPDSAVSRSLRVRITEFAAKGAVTVRDARLHNPETVATFYRTRNFRRVWASPSAKNDLLEAIRGMEKDGLSPRIYHLNAIEALLEEGKEKPSAEIEADLDVLLTDAAAAMVDHVQYGRVRPVALDSRWNVNPREGAIPLEEQLARVVGSGSPAKAIEEVRPRHFIYQGLVEALARLREIADQGGWPAIPAGKKIRPGARDPRIPVIRQRLAASGELRGRTARDSTTYDRDLQAAVTLFKQRHRLDDDPIIDKNTTDAMSVGVEERIGQVRVNLERARWVLGGLSDDFLLVNLPAYKVYLIRGGRNVWEARTQIGKEARQTPTFRSTLKTIVFNPDWTVPPTILAEDILEGMKKGENVVAEKNLTILDTEGQEVSPGSIDWGSATPENFPYTLRQPPGEDNALGRVKIEFPNRFSIYLHDTPRRELFEADQRAFSSGCIRVENALQLVERLLAANPGWNGARIRQAVEDGKTQHVKIEDQVPVLIVYWTVSVGASGETRYMRDVYELDPPVLAALEAPRRSGATARR